MRAVGSGNTVYYYADDMLGSSRTMIQAGQSSVCYDADFLPFGYEKDVNISCSQAYKFEGKERDTETGNDDFGARYYSPNSGRWLSADWSSIPEAVPYANLTNPQTLNLYAMVQDNPETFGDLDGHDSISPSVINPGSSSCDEGASSGCQPVVLDPSDYQVSQENEQQQQTAQPQTTSGTATQSAQQQNTDTVTVEEVKGQGLNGGPFGFNHAAISVDGKQAVGLEQKKDCGTCAVEDKTTPGAVKPADPKRTILSHATIHITRDQARRIQIFLDKAAKSPPNYNLYHSNCAQFCEAALGAGRVKAPSDVTPAGLVDDLRKLYPQQ